MIEISSTDKTIYGSIDLESSKSISNRLLIIKELCKTKFEIQNLSNARDTKILFEILSSYKNWVIIKISHGKIYCRTVFIKPSIHK